MINDSLLPSLHSHLAWWGLKRFTSDADYFAWQQKQLSPADLSQLHSHVEQKRRGKRRDEVAFYDLTAQPHILPVLYSQRYEYYYEIGSRVAARLGDANSILDFGCGIGILPTFYATQWPEKHFVGIDRSHASIAVAREKARELGLRNARFECVDIEYGHLAESYDLIVGTHALVQAEHDPGTPSHSWRTFERAPDKQRQAAFEQRTGIGIRLDRLSALLVPNGNMIVFEKTRQLARRVPFQRALAARGLQLIEACEPICYQVVEEVAEDGPFYFLRMGHGASVNWDESPEADQALLFDQAKLHAASTDPDTPLYENHSPSAQRVWEQLHEKRVVKETTRLGPDGQQMHVEVGQAVEGVYLYCANTLDQRQLALVEPARRVILESYYQEIANSAP